MGREEGRRSSGGRRICIRELRIREGGKGRRSGPKVRRFQYILIIWERIVTTAVTNSIIMLVFYSL